jgi:hypothetical protein
MRRAEPENVMWFVGLREGSRFRADDADRAQDKHPIAQA